MSESATARDEWPRLTAANDDIDAQLLVGALEESGIATRTVKNRSGPGDYLLGGSNPRAPVAIHVQASELDRARRLVDELRAPAVVEGEPGDVAVVRGRGWPTYVAVVIVGVIVLLFLLEQKDLVL